MHQSLEKNINAKELAEYEQKHPLGFGSPDDIAMLQLFSYQMLRNG